ncbi:hypothetical protein QT693_22490, partial [Xanthomonas citri pv. citri]
SVERGQQERIKSIDKKLHLPLWQKLGVGNTLSQNLSHYSQMLGTDEFIFYEKYLKPIGICFVAAVLLDQGDHQWSLLGIHRSEQDQPFSQFELDILKRIGLHLRRALQIHKQLSLARLENHNLYQILNAAKTGILLIDLDRKVHYL